MSEKNYPTRMHEICRMEPMIPFEFVCNGMKYTLVIEHEGHVWRLNHAKGRRMLAASIVSELVNHPERIIRKPRLTEEQIAELKAAMVFGMKWLAIDCLWTIGTLYKTRPDKCTKEGYWMSSDGTIHNEMELPKDAKITSLVSWDDTEPLDIVQTLRDAGVEVEG